MRVPRLSHLAALAMTLGCGAACKSTAPASVYSPPSAENRDSARAEKLTREAAELIDSDPDRAEELLRNALAADLYHGPAHNNLGVVFLGRGNLYEAAHEFEWARKLMPGHPDPRVNLGIVMDTAGRTAEARTAYEAALDVWPGYVPAMQGLASLAVRTNERSEELRGWLERIALEGEDHQWRAWARGKLARTP